MEPKLNYRTSKELSLDAQLKSKIESEYSLGITQSEVRDENRGLKICSHKSISREIATSEADDKL